MTGSVSLDLGLIKMMRPEVNSPGFWCKSLMQTLMIYKLGFNLHVCFDMTNQDRSVYFLELSL